MTINSTLIYTNEVPMFNTDSPRTLFQHLALTDNFRHRASAGWRVVEGQTLAAMDGGGDCLATLSNGSQTYSGVYQLPYGYVLITLNGMRYLQAEIAASSPENVAAYLAMVRERFPQRPHVSPREEVHVSFWSLGPNGARSMERTIGIAPWATVQTNYSGPTHEALHALMDGFKPTRAGQLILWYGPPGTGKTHALRALAWEWRKWCSFHYITDPETFFGGSASYMLDVLLLRNEDGPMTPDTSDDETDEAEDTKPDDAMPRWRLLILEDSGELMAPEAKSHTGQGLSRFLNVVDGLIGQGLRLMVLVTTNEEVTKLHPAVARPGRCAARIAFSEMKRPEALAWLAAHDYTGDLPIAPTYSLASLYSLLGTKQTVAEPAKLSAVGFTQ